MRDSADATIPFGVIRVGDLHCKAPHHSKTPNIKKFVFGNIKNLIEQQDKLLSETEHCKVECPDE
jgi:hypothetical protein